MNDYRLKPGRALHLDDWDTDDSKSFRGGKEAARTKLDTLNDRLEALQEALYAEGKRRILVVLQGMDTSGKDGVIRHVFEGVNPQGVRVASFKAPSAEELAHDYLWRIHQQAPARGEIVIFNRSHYEDVLIVRVHNLVPREIWSRRFDQINDFERMLTEEGTLILKFFLHISRDEQRRRLQARLDDATKHWKFNPADLNERQRWPDYMQAYEEALTRTSTEWAPWRIIPSDRKWYRNLAIASVLVEAIESLKPRYPKAAFDPGKITIV